MVPAIRITYEPVEDGLVILFVPVTFTTFAPAATVSLVHTVKRMFSSGAVASNVTVTSSAPPPQEPTSVMPLVETSDAVTPVKLKRSPVGSN